MIVCQFRQRLRTQQLFAQHQDDQNNRQGRHGQIDSKAPPPARLGEIPAHHGANGIAHRSKEREERPVEGVVGQRDFVCENGAYRDVDARGADALEGAADEQGWKRGGGCAGADGGADEHDGDGELDGEVTAKDVGCLGPKGEEGGCGEVEDGDDPVLFRDAIYTDAGGSQISNRPSGRVGRPGVRDYWGGGMEENDLPNFSAMVGNAAATMVVSSACNVNGANRPSTIFHL